MKNLLAKTYSLLVAAVVAASAFTYDLNAGHKGGLSIAEIVITNPDIDNDGEDDFDTLLTAVLLADPSVLDRLSSNGQNTVFAPTDAAFDAAFEELAGLGIAPRDVLENTEMLALILNYHVSPGYGNSKMS